MTVHDRARGITTAAAAQPTRNLNLAYAVSAGIALVLAIASVLSVVNWQRFYPRITPDMLPLFVGQDVLNLLVALPMLVGGMWLARRGALIGLLIWPGALFYVAYDYGYYALGAPFNALFIPYLVLMAASTFTIAGILASIDGEAVRARLDRVPNRLVGGFLIGLALLFIALWTGMSVSAIASGTELPMVPKVVTIMDFTVQLPALLVGGVLLWTRETLGYVVAPGLLLQAATYLMGLSAITVLQEALMNAPLDLVAVGPGLVVGVIALGLLVPFIRESAATGANAAGHRSVPNMHAAHSRHGE